MRPFLFAAFVSLGLLGCGGLDESETGVAQNAQAVTGPVEGEPQPQLDTSQMFPAPAWTDPTRRVNFQEHFMYTVDVTRPCGH